MNIKTIKMIAPKDRKKNGGNFFGLSVAKNESFPLSGFITL